jgi:ubiquinone/menaquinone biosynthesis C-methylase UbiE
MLDFRRPWLTVSRLLDILAPAPGERLLEVGAGTGAYPLPVARAVGPEGALDAFDVQREMLGELMRRAQRQGIANVRPEQGDASRLPYPDASFDGAFLVTVLHEIPDRDAALREMHRVVKAGGRSSARCLRCPPSTSCAREISSVAPRRPASTSTGAWARAWCSTPGSCRDGSAG